MKNKGYTIMEAVIAMFLVVVMVGAVFSALMSSRRAIVTSSEREEIFYSLKSAYGMLKDCRSNPDCQLTYWSTTDKPCPSSFTAGAGANILKDCNNLFTFNFANLCKATDDKAVFQYTVTNSANKPVVKLYKADGTHPNATLTNFYVLDMEAKCQEAS